METVKHAEHNTQNRTPASATESGGSPELRHQERSAVPVSSGDTQPLSTGAEVVQASNHISTEKVLSSIADKYLQAVQPSTVDEFFNFLAYMEKMRITITGVKVGSLVITVKCDSLQILEVLWEDYLSGYLGEVVQRCFVTNEILTELSLAELELKTTILEEEYTAYKMYFQKGAAIRG